MTLVYFWMLSDDLSFTASPEHGDIEFFSEVSPYTFQTALNVRLPEGSSIRIPDGGETTYYHC